MGAILYFAPGRQAITLDEIQALGIDTRGVISPKTRAVTGGPNGQHGIVFVLEYDGHKPRDFTVGFYPDRQVWEQAPGREYWNGYYREDKPGPDDLSRADGLRSYPVTLLDGNDWLIPIGRYVATRNGVNTPLPLMSRYNGKTHEPGGVLMEYQWIFDVGTRALEILNGDRKDDFTWSEQAEMCCRLLAVNYHVGPCEIDLLRLLSQEQQATILHMAGDGPGWWAIKKKEAEGIASSSVGDADSSETTSQP